MQSHRIVLGAVSALTVLSLAACGGGSTPDAQVGGTVAGLAAGSTLTLSENNTTILSVGANGGFELPTMVPADQTYTVAVQSQPTGQMCSVANASGSVDSNGDPVNNVAVTCVNVATVGGSVAGLATNAMLTLSDGSSTLTISANGNFTFADAFAPGAPYAVAITGQPAGQTCAVSNGAGSIDAAGDAVGAVVVACAPNQTVAGTVAGLLPGGTGLTLSDGNLTLVLTSNGLFNFGDVLAPNSAYAVSVVSQPQGQSCAISNGAGAIDANGDAVTNVGVICTVNGSVSGTLSGLATGSTVVISDGLNSSPVAANGSFTALDVFSAGAAYSISVVTQPTGQTCVVNNGSGTVDANDDAVTGVTISCS